MLRKITMFLLVAGLGVQMYPDVSARERDRIPTPVRSTVVHGSIVRAAISDITTWIVAPKEWRGEKSLILAEAAPSTRLAPLPEPTIPMKPKFAFAELVMKTSDKYQMDWRLVASVMAVESSYNPQALSDKGATGLMQVMPTTAAKYRIQSDELFDPARNIEAGVRHLKWLTKRYPGELEKAVAAYNSGEGAVDKFGGVPPFKPTRSFVKKVMARYQNHLNRYPSNAVKPVLMTSLRAAGR